MPIQLQIEWSPVHARENSALNEAQLNEFRDKFSHDCFEVLKRLVRGDRLTVKIAMDEFLSGDLRRRIKDLRDFVIHISDNKTKGGYKEYFMDEQDKITALKMIMSKLKTAA